MGSTLVVRTNEREYNDSLDYSFQKDMLLDKLERFIENNDRHDYPVVMVFTSIYDDGSRGETQQFEIFENFARIQVFSNEAVPIASLSISADGIVSFERFDYTSSRNSQGFVNGVISHIVHGVSRLFVL